MRKNNGENPTALIFAVYAACYLFRLVEYFAIRTDQGVLGEAVLHKLMGILILALVVRRLSLRWAEIGFRRRGAGKDLLFGLLLGAAAFLPAYAAEFCLQAAGGNQPGLRLYVSSYTVGGNLGHQTGLLFFAVCALGNAVNVVMEEGVFRGLFLNLAERRRSFLRAALLSSALFGLWHVAAPARSLLDGEIGVPAAVVSAAVLVATSGIAGVGFCLLVRATGSLWTAMAAHFLNNFLVNILHVATAAGADELQMVRLTVAQTLSFLMAAALYFKSGARRRETFRP